MSLPKNPPSNNNFAQVRSLRKEGLEASNSARSAKAKGVRKWDSFFDSFQALWRWEGTSTVFSGSFKGFLGGF